MARYLILSGKYINMTTNRQGLSEIEIISDLIRINYARAECLEDTMRKNERLGMESTVLFTQLGKKCRANVAELIRLTVLPEHFFPKFLLSPGFIFEVWLDRKEASKKKDRASLLFDCEHREEAALEAYKAALISGVLTDSSVRQLVLDQKHDLQVTQDRIRKQADLNELFLEEYDDQPIKLNDTFINIKAG